MDLNDDILKRWLELATDSEPLGLANTPFKGGSEEELRVWNRLQLMKGLLATLDSRQAPAELDELVARQTDLIMRAQAKGTADEPCEVELDLEGVADAFAKGLAESDNAGTWLDELAESVLDGSSADSKSDYGPDYGAGFGPGKAPEFLDRIVEQRLSAIEGQLREVRRGERRVRLVRRASLALTGALVLLFVPWTSLLRQAPQTEIQMIEHSSLESLQSAYPEQVRFAGQFGEFGAFSTQPAKALGKSPGKAIDRDGGLR